MIAWSRGASKTDADPEQRESADFDELIRAVDQDRAREKGQAYFAAPFRENGTPGRGHRSKDMVLPVGFIILDFDHLLPDMVAELTQWLKRFYGAAWPTHSSTATQPRRRVVLALSRLASRDECIAVNSALAQDVREEFGIELDTAAFRPEQPGYMPPPRVVFDHFYGEPIDVDLYVHAAQHLLPAVQSRGALTVVAEGGRNNALTRYAGRLRRAGADADEIIDALAARNARFAPPLAKQEVQTIARSVARYPVSAEDERLPELPLRLDIAALAAREPVKPRFIVQDWLPQGEVTLMGAHGGVGKSMIGLQLAATVCTGRPFFGLDTEQRSVAFLSYEDSQEVLHWRLARICAWLGLDMAGLHERLAVFDGSRTLGAWFAPYKGECGPTREYFAIAEMLSAYQLIIVDGSSDTFAANENDRGQVKGFIRLLKRLTPPTGALLLLAHVDKMTAKMSTTSEGYSGSTGWNNGPRARWYVHKQEDDDSILIGLQKSNSGRAGAQIKLRWDPQAHVFDGAVEGQTSFDRKYRLDSARLAVLRCFKDAAERNQAVPAATTGKRNVLSVLTELPDFPLWLRERKNVPHFWALLENLRLTCLIREDPLRSGSRKWVSILQITPEGIKECA